MTDNIIEVMMMSNSLIKNNFTNIEPLIKPHTYIATKINHIQNFRDVKSNEVKLRFDVIRFFAGLLRKSLSLHFVIVRYFFLETRYDKRVVQIR